jgi:hypothetical protein
MPGLSPEQIIALAPDPGSAKAGKELAFSRKWLSLGSNRSAAWGECQGSAKAPYQTQIDLGEPAFKCSCPSRKFPCKHALGLYLLLASQPGAFTQYDPPAWVTDWLTKRKLAAEKPARMKEKGEKTPDAAPSAEAARRTIRRAERVRQGLEDLDLWLSDLVRQGLSASQVQSASFWETPAARLVDAQIPGLARKVRKMASLPGSGDGWQERLLAQAGELFLLIAGYSHLDRLPPSTREDIRSQIGWFQDQEELLNQTGVPDQWTILGRRVEEETLGALGRSSSLKVQRTWLWGSQTRRPALVISFAAPGQLLDTSLIPGTRLEAELVFYPGGFPLRALIKKQNSRPAPDNTAMPGFSDLLEANQAYTAALTANPWLDLFPMPLRQVTPFLAGETWGVRDATGRFFPYAAGFSLAWTIQALSGGNPLDLFGEWNGATLWPLSAWSDGRFVQLLPVRVEDQKE